jgi:hypothetical protein
MHILIIFSGSYRNYNKSLLSNSLALKSNETLKEITIIGSFWEYTSQSTIERDFLESFSKIHSTVKVNIITRIEKAPEWYQIDLKEVFPKSVTIANTCLIQLYSWTRALELWSEKEIFGINKIDIAIKSRSDLGFRSKLNLSKIKAFIDKHPHTVITQPCTIIMGPSAFNDQVFFGNPVSIRTLLKSFYSSIQFYLENPNLPVTPEYLLFDECRKHNLNQKIIPNFTLIQREDYTDQHPKGRHLGS